MHRVWVRIYLKSTVSFFRNTCRTSEYALLMFLLLYQKTFLLNLRLEPIACYVASCTLLPRRKLNRQKSMNVHDTSTVATDHVHMIKESEIKRKPRSSSGVRAKCQRWAIISKGRNAYRFGRATQTRRAMPASA